jgi:hypothetical protein
MSFSAERLQQCRRARQVKVTWRDEQLVLIHQTHDRQRGTGRSPISTCWKLIRPEDLYSLLPEYTPVSCAAVRELTKNTFLVKEGTPLAKRDADLDRVWSDWLPYGGFHFATKDFEYIDAPVSFYQRYLAASPQPALLKTYDKAPRIQLPRVHVPMKGEPDSEFERVLLARKTHRDFSRKQVPLNTISTLLHHTGSYGQNRCPPLTPVPQDQSWAGRGTPAKSTCLPSASRDYGSTTRRPASPAERIGSAKAKKLRFMRPNKHCGRCFRRVHHDRGFPRVCGSTLLPAAIAWCCSTPATPARHFAWSHRSAWPIHSSDQRHVNRKRSRIGRHSRTVLYMAATQAGKLQQTLSVLADLQIRPSPARSRGICPRFWNRSTGPAFGKAPKAVVGMTAR